jgi:hypothetical protein
VVYSLGHSRSVTGLLYLLLIIFANVLSLRAKSFIFQFAVPKYKDYEELSVLSIRKKLGLSN